MMVKALGLNHLKTKVAHHQPVKKTIGSGSTPAASTIAKYSKRLPSHLDPPQAPFFEAKEVGG